ncbi:lysoplasmalogenase [Streptacidiphilus monticola]|uniref:Lysoplasmalogenase n=1 Tax=Streptacidiphilus monticola TaxID=2161674 RepID=A0ABW1G2A1_9ACTN
MSSPATGVLTRPQFRLQFFVFLAAAHLLTVAVDDRFPAAVTKALLMPALAWLVAPRAPRLLLAALLASCLGDVMLLFSGTSFLVGMGGFAAAHVCYITLFRRIGGRRNRWAWLYLPLWAALIVSLWPGLDPAMRVPVASYSLLLTGMAATSARVSRRTALGGGLFLLSDTLIATGLADSPQLPLAHFWVMLTYIVGQFLIATGVTAGQDAHARQPGAQDSSARDFGAQDSNARSTTTGA